MDIVPHANKTLEVTQQRPPVSMTKTPAQPLKFSQPKDIAKTAAVYSELMAIRQLVSMT